MCHYYYLEQFSSFTWPALSRFCFNMTSKYLLNPKNFKIKLPDEANSEFDRLIQDRWQDLMAKGHFRYDISSMKSRQVGKFVAQLNPMRATTRRKPESMLTVRQPFDHQKFNFTKGSQNASKTFLAVELGPTSVAKGCAWSRCYKDKALRIDSKI